MTREEEGAIPQGVGDPMCNFGFYGKWNWMARTDFK